MYVRADCVGGPDCSDDIQVEETALLNVVRRDGAPLRLREETTGELLTETVDYSYVEDPFWSHWQIKPGDDPNLHPMPAVTALAGGKLHAGQVVALDYYALAPVYDGTAASCLTHPAIRDYMVQNMAAMTQSNGGFPGYLLSYDEMRTGHTCELCASHGATAGELLAEHLQNSSAIAR